MRVGAWLEEWEREEEEEGGEVYKTYEERERREKETFVTTNAPASAWRRMGEREASGLDAVNETQLIFS